LKKPKVKTTLTTKAFRLSLVKSLDLPILFNIQSTLH